MRSFPTITVIIPCYNDGEYLREALDSVFHQSSDDWEIIVVDDCSTDVVTQRVLSGICDERVRLFRTQEQSGPAVARNLAIRNAAGSYILPLDADDKIGTSYLEKAKNLLDSSMDLEIVYCHASLFGLSHGPWKLPSFEPSRFVLDNMIFSSALFRKSTWERVGGYSENMLEGMEDYDFWIKILSHGGRVHCINECLFHYRIKRKSRTTVLLSKKNDDISAAYAKLLENNISFFSRKENVRVVFLELQKRLHKEKLLESSFVWRYCFFYLVKIELAARELVAKLVRGVD